MTGFVYQMTVLWVITWWCCVMFFRK